MPSDKFRRQLSQEAEKWLAERLIDNSTYEQLAKRYQFRTLETADRNRFILILLGLGSILLGLGIITFVQANWQGWSREFKVISLLSVFIGVNTAGFYLWRSPHRQWQHRLGQGLLLLGALSLGANMALMSRIFQHSGQLYELFLLWGLGVLAMSYSLRMSLLGILAILLTEIGYVYWQRVPKFLITQEASWLQLIMQHMPIFASVMFIPLAYWCRSRWIFRLGAIAVVYAVEVKLIGLDLLHAPAWIAAIACALPPALLWAYGDSLWQIPPSLKLFESTARTLAIAFLSLLFYLLSFYWWWNSSIPITQSIQESSPPLWPSLIDIVILGGLTLWAWLRLWRKRDLTTGVLAVMIAISALIPYWHLSISRLPIAAVIIYNMLLLLLAAGLVREGLLQGERRFFWGGLVLLTLQVFTRMIEYETDLLFKSFVFFLCGFGVMAAGIWFERHLKTLKVKG